ncbi:hypothetical protein QR680_004255 [Steinernema hermaphroditum]|uniref:Uncharacterized protein n=1 Tax=Steinernema hermaphroditum TaxID=289476 RepID=A0AA39HP71_9BILA|nr:hypothetical protein QR680_004255 [Steinernema hermaphroditum]
MALSGNFQFRPPNNADVLNSERPSNEEVEYVDADSKKIALANADSIIFDSIASKKAVKDVFTQSSSFLDQSLRMVDKMQEAIDKKTNQIKANNCLTMEGLEKEMKELSEVHRNVKLLDFAAQRYGLSLIKGELHIIYTHDDCVFAGELELNEEEQVAKLIRSKQLDRGPLSRGPGPCSSTVWDFNNKLFSFEKDKIYDNVDIRLPLFTYDNRLWYISAEEETLFLNTAPGESRREGSRIELKQLNGLSLDNIRECNMSHVIGDYAYIWCWHSQYRGPLELWKINLKEHTIENITSLIDGFEDMGEMCRGANDDNSLYVRTYDGWLWKVTLEDPHTDEVENSSVQLTYLKSIKCPTDLICGGCIARKHRGHDYEEVQFAGSELRESVLSEVAAAEPLAEGYKESMHELIDELTSAAEEKLKRLDELSILTETQRQKIRENNFLTKEQLQKEADALKGIYMKAHREVDAIEEWKEHAKRVLKQ